VYVDHQLARSVNSELVSVSTEAGQNAVSNSDHLGSQFHLEDPVRENHCQVDEEAILYSKLLLQSIN
jgi:hypothetical protein